MAEVKSTDGLFFLAFVLMLISISITATNLASFTSESTVFLFRVRVNLVAAIVFALGVGSLAVAFAGRFKLAINSGVFMFFQGTGLVTAILGFFVCGLAILPYYTPVTSVPQLIAGLLIWAIGVFLATFTGICNEQREERIVFFIVLVALIVSVIALSIFLPQAVTTI
jgi:hypothetical protein